MDVNQSNPVAVAGAFLKLRLITLCILIALVN